MTDSGTITTRNVALAGDISGITNAAAVYPASLDGLLPFCFVDEGAATFRKIDSSTIEVTQDFPLLLYVAEFETEITGQEDAAYQACRPFLTSVPYFYWQHTRLQRGDQGLADVKSAALTEHQGIQSASRDNKEYMGVAFTLSVVYDQYVEEV